MTDELVEGILVCWTGAEGFGIVNRLDGGRVEVRWDVPGRPTMFAVGSAPLRRVHLPPRVVRQSTGQAGILGGQVSTKPPRWTVTFFEAGTLIDNVVPEADLRPYQPVGPLERMGTKACGSTREFVLALATRYYRLEHLHNDLVSLGHARVDVKPHQVGVVHRVVTGYPHRYLLCDEVGLGKTIEAGMILKELRARGLASRCLIIVPANLLRQWQFELKSKFNELFAILNSSTVNYLREQGHDGNPFARYDSVLASADWIASSRWAQQATRVDWDMVIVDEAHHARRTRTGTRAQTTQLYDLLRHLAADQFGNRSLLLLTATPMQLAAEELHALVELVDPALFPTLQVFERHRREAPRLSLLVDALRQHGFPVPGDDADRVVKQVASWLRLDEDVVETRLRAGGSGIEDICERLEERHLLSEVLIRNRKAVVGGFMPRRATRWAVELREDERLALDAVERYVMNGFNVAERTSDHAIGFVMVTFQKLMASSIRALRESLAGRRERLAQRDRAPLPSGDRDDTAPDDTLVMDLIGPVRAAHDQESAELDALVELLDAVEVDSKARVFLDRLAIIFGADSNAKVLVFTEFRETQRYLASELERRGWGVNVFHGRLSPLDKDRAVERFREDPGPQVLVCTEAGGEGRNFQFCHLLVNYDLPWNPMRVEQRIGRVDRIGQREVVQVFNMWVKGTIEERVLNVLEHRINVFEETVGGLDPILGDTERDLRRVLSLAVSERDQALKALEQQLESQVRQARLAEDQLRDLIMDTKSFSREIAERIVGQRSPVTAADQERFITALLADVHTHIGKPSSGERELTFHDPFLGDHPALFVEGPKRRAVFRPDDRQDTEHVEYFAFGHPIVEAIVARVLRPQYPGSAGTWRVTADDNLIVSRGWLFAYVLTISGFRPMSTLLSIFVTVDGAVNEAMGSALISRATRFPREGEAAVAMGDVPVETLGDRHQLAEGYVARFAKDLEADAQREALQRHEREHAKLLAYFAHRRQAATDRRRATGETLRRLEASTEEGDRRIIPAWIANLERDDRILAELTHERDRRLQELDKGLHPVVSWELAHVGWVEVVPSGSVAD